MPKPIPPYQSVLWEPPHSDWRPPKISDLPSWTGAKRVSIDTETCDPQLTTMGIGVRRGGYVVGYSFAIEDGPSFYVPMHHAGGDNVEDPDQARAYLRDQCKHYAGMIVGQNLFSYDLDYMLEDGVEFHPNVTWRDVMINEALIDELQDAYNLDAICKRRGLPGKDEELLKRAAEYYGVDPKGGMWAMPARFVGAYGDVDARRPLQVLRRQERDIEDQELERIVELESQVGPMLVRMRRRGVPVDMDRLAKVEEWSIHEEKSCLDYIHWVTGHRIEVGDTMKAGAVLPALAAAGLELADIKIGETDTGKPKLDKELFARCGFVGAALARARKMAQLRGTFAEDIRQFEIDGKIYCNYNQSVRPKDGDDEASQGARYGRPSVNKPNLANQPSRDDYAGLWRSIYRAEKDSLWGSADYSAQEPRLIAHYAILAEVEGADRIEQAYKENPRLDIHDWVAGLTGLKRSDGKSISLGIPYGMGSGKMARQLGLPTIAKTFVDDEGKTVHYEAAGPEAQDLFERYDRYVPHARALRKVAEARAKEVGYIVTIGGRRCRFPRAGRKYKNIHKALNRAIQGSGADQTKKAMVEIDRAGYGVVLQIYDSIETMVAGPAELKIVAEIMAETIPLRVPVKVDMAIGPSWGELEKWGDVIR